MTDAWSKDLGQFLTAIWAEIGDFTHPRGGFAGLATLATHSDDGPELRQLVVRGADRAAGLVHLHTDSETPKCAQIAADPRVAILFWNPETLLQIRLNGRAEILGSYAAKQAWADLPFASRGNYGVMPAPGTRIDHAHAYDRSADENRLAVIAVRALEIDAVHLGDPRHIRAKFTEADGWAGQWVAP